MRVGIVCFHCTCSVYISKSNSCSLEHYIRQWQMKKEIFSTFWWCHKLLLESWLCKNIQQLTFAECWYLSLTCMINIVLGFPGNCAWDSCCPRHNQIAPCLVRCGAHSRSSSEHVSDGGDGPLLHSSAACIHCRALPQREQEGLIDFKVQVWWGIMVLMLVYLYFHIRVACLVLSYPSTSISPCRFCTGYCIT